MTVYPPAACTLYPPSHALNPISPAALYPPTGTVLYPLRPHRALLALDLLETIIENVKHESRTLKQCALVNSTWLVLVRPRLFRTITINSDERLEAITHALGELDWLPNVVQELVCGEGSRVSPAAQEGCDARHLCRLTRVHTLRWYALDWDALATRPESRAGLLALFARVRTLALYNVVRSSAQVAGFLGCFPALARLHLGGIAMWYDVARDYAGGGLRPLCAQQRPRPAVLSLDGTIHTQPQLWLKLMDALDFSGLTQIKTGNSARQIAEIMACMSAHSRDSLQALDITVDFNYNDISTASGLCASVSAATHLRDLHIHAKIVTKDAAPAPSLARFVAASKSADLTRVAYSLNFGSAGCENFSRMDWAQIGAAVQEKCKRCPALRARFILTGIDDASAREDALAGLNALVRDRHAVIEFL